MMNSVKIAIQKFLVHLLCLFIPSKTLRRKIRNKFYPRPATSVFLQQLSTYLEQIGLSSLLHNPHYSRDRETERRLMDYLILNQRILAAALAQIAVDNVASISPEPPEKPIKIGLKSKISTQADIESDWHRYWNRVILDGNLIYNRKRWEYAFISQALYENDLLAPGKKGLGLGCGTEELPCFFASLGCKITAGDQPLENARGSAWIDTKQYTNSLKDLYKPQYMTQEAFSELFSLEYVDMNFLPEKLYGQFDFCWSVCAVEHLGSIQKGLDFMVNSMKLLKKGGISVHTTEFNYMDTDQTIDDCDTVLFQKRHFECLEARIRESGGIVCPFDFNLGDGLLDKFIDLHPNLWLTSEYRTDAFVHHLSPHIKLSVLGFPTTCFGVIIQKSKE